MSCLSKTPTMKVVNVWDIARISGPTSSVPCSHAMDNEVSLTCHTEWRRQVTIWDAQPVLLIRLPLIQVEVEISAYK